MERYPRAFFAGQILKFPRFRAREFGGSGFFRRGQPEPRLHVRLPARAGSGGERECIMTADLLDFAQSSRPAFPVQIPDWVPAVVATHASNSFRPYSPALVRLLSDSRMKTVWAQFSRRRQLTGQYLYPARVTLNRQAEASRRQDIAMLMLFGLACELGEHRPRPSHGVT